MATLLPIKYNTLRHKSRIVVVRRHQIRVGLQVTHLTMLRWSGHDCRFNVAKSLLCFEERELVLSLSFLLTIRTSVGITCSNSPTISRFSSNLITGLYKFNSYGEHYHFHQTDVFIKKYSSSRTADTLGVLTLCSFINVATDASVESLDCYKTIRLLRSSNVVTLDAVHQ